MARRAAKAKAKVRVRAAAREADAKRELPRGITRTPMLFGVAPRFVCESGARWQVERFLSVSIARKVTNLWCWWVHSGRSGPPLEAPVSFTSFDAALRDVTSTLRAIRNSLRRVH